MRCPQAQHHLSLNLDGRLSSGQRKLLLEHLDRCDACRALDRELNEARQLALSLPTQHVSGGFREELWERIRAGEGTPEAVFREPIPFATKMRYFGVGAAAAALLIAAVTLVRPRDTIAPNQPTVVAQDAPRLTPRPAPEHLPGLATPDRVATLVADGYADAVRQLRARVDDLQTPHTPPAQLVHRVRDDADRARHFASLIRWFVDRNYMMLPQDDAASLATIELVGQQVHSIDDTASLRGVLEPLRQVRIERTRSFFCSPCVEDEASFFREFATRVQRTPDLAAAMPIRFEMLLESDDRRSQGRVIIFMR